MPHKDLTEHLTIELPAGTLAALEAAARENYTTPLALIRAYVLHGLEQTVLQRKFDCALTSALLE